ncbi:MAG TPA: biopolymer transporter ExbD [Vicinamibacteria bacterium]|nr:biopolymer transporter ExbD [Vicinamibacteria bacterium]
MQATGGGEGGGAVHAAATYKTLRSRHGAALLADINVVPLVDVVLVLLLVFMVTAPMMSRGIDVTLPTAESRDDREEDRTAVTVDPQGRLYLEGRLVPTLIELQERVKQIMETRAAKVVYLRADESLQYGKVIQVVDVLKKAGVEQVGFVYVLPQERPRR